MKYLKLFETQSSEIITDEERINIKNYNEFIMDTSNTDDELEESDEEEEELDLEQEQHKEREQTLKIASEQISHLED